MCGTLAVGTAKKEGNGNLLLERIATTTYEKCRSNPSAGIITNFPDFGPLLAEMDAATSAVEAQATDSYQVTVLHPDGSLVIKEQFFQQFGAGENEIQEFHDLVKKHDETFNTNGVRLASEAAPVRQEPESQAVAAMETEKPLTAETLANLDLSKP